MAHLKRNNYKEIQRDSGSGSPSIDSMMREVLHMLGNIDFEHEVQLEEIEKHTADQELKRSIRKKVVAAHRERREPYVELLAQLRQRQHRQSLRN
jgi:hypothetical protein